MIKRFLFTFFIYLAITTALYAAFPTVDDTSSGSRAANTSHNIPLPTTCAAGKTLIVFVSSADAPNQTTATWSGSWAEITDEGNGDANLQIGWLKSTGAEAGGTVTLTLNQSAEIAYITYCIGNAGDPATTPPQAGTPSEATTEFPDPPNLTPTGGAKDYLWFAVVSLGTSTRIIDSYPTNYTNGIRVAGVNGASSGNLALARRELNAASENPGTFDLDLSTTTPVAQTIVIHPSATVATNFPQIIVTE